LLGATTYLDAYKFGVVQGLVLPTIMEQKRVIPNPVQWSKPCNAYIKVCGASNVEGLLLALPT
jgi:hypothetical protein